MLEAAEALFFPAGRARSCGSPGRGQQALGEENPLVDKLECYAAKSNPYESMLRARAREAAEDTREYEDRVFEMYLARLRRMKDEMLAVVDEDCLYLILNALRGRDDPNGTYEGMQRAVAETLDELWSARRIPAAAASEPFCRTLQDFSVMFTHYLLIMR